MDLVSPTWQTSMLVGVNYTYAQFAAYLPRLAGALLVLIIGLLLARLVRSIVVKALEALTLGKLLEATPLDIFLKNAEFGQKFEGVVGGIVYWLLVLLVLHTSMELLGLTTIVRVLDVVFSYLPHVVSALLIFVFGVLIAGVVESLVKGAVRSVDVHSSRMFAKIASYLVVAIASLAAVSELGIASEFIRILFVGMVFALSLGLGLSFGLGGQDVVRKMMDRWYSKSQE